MIGVYGLIHTVILLTASFFVLVVASKLKKGALRSFGNIIALFLLALSALTFIIGLYSVSQGRCSMKKMMGMKGMGGKQYKMMHHMKK